MQIRVRQIAWLAAALAILAAFALSRGERSLAPHVPAERRPARAATSDAAAPDRAHTAAASASAEARRPGAPTPQPPAAVPEPERRADPVLAEAPAPHVWRLEDEPTHALDHRVGGHLPERVALEIDAERIAALAVGDRFTIALPGLGELTATVAWVNEAENGDRGLGAILDGSDQEYGVTLTLGDRALFAQVATDEGRFLVEGASGAAAVFRDDLEQVLVDPTRTDERIPPLVAEDPT